MNGVLKGMLIALIIVYVVSPLDLCPGPIDDILLLLLLGLNPFVKTFPIC